MPISCAGAGKPSLSAIEAPRKPIPSAELGEMAPVDARWLKLSLTPSQIIGNVAALRCGLDHTLWCGEGTDRCRSAVNATTTVQIVDGETVPMLPFDVARAHALYKGLLGSVEDLIRGKHLLVVPSGALTSLPFNVLVTEAPKTAVPATFADYRGVAWLGARQPITVLPSVASLKALRQFAKASRANKTYLGIGNPLLDGRAEAFRISMRELIANGTAAEAHPSQWAPFVVVGEGGR